MRATIIRWICPELCSFGKVCGGNKKYHTVKWAQLSEPKEFGGLGFCLCDKS
jgi:hypothetical protein